MKSSTFPARSKRCVGFGLYPTQKVVQALQKKDKGFLAFFTPHEKTYCFDRRRGAESLAARMAAKKAFWDALEIKHPLKKFKPSEWKKIGVERKKPGPPTLVVANELLQKLKLPAKTGFLLTITHERAFAVAVVAIQVP